MRQSGSNTPSPPGLDIEHATDFKALYRKAEHALVTTERTKSVTPVIVRRKREQRVRAGR